MNKTLFEQINKQKCGECPDTRKCLACHNRFLTEQMKEVKDYCCLPCTRKEKRYDKTPPVHNSSDLLDQMTEADLKNLKHGHQGQSGHGDGVAGFCMWCGDEFTNLVVSHEVVRFKKNVGSCYFCFINQKKPRTLEEQVRFMWKKWHEFRKEEAPNE